MKTITIPVKFLTSTKISSPEKIFILRIKLLMSDENVLYNSNKEIEKLTGYTIPTIMKHLSDLRKKEVFTPHNNKNGRRIIKFTSEFEELLF